MPRRPEDVDWDVDLSDRLERREERRKWIVLGLCVIVALLAIGGLTALAVLHKRGYLGRWREVISPRRTEEPVQPKEAILPPVSVESVQEGDIKFTKLDGAGLMTSVNYFFRELLPQKATVFTVNRDTDTHGAILEFRLRNIGTGEAYTFQDVEVKLMGGEWTITEEGWTKVRNELQAKMNLLLSKPTM